MTSEAVKLDRKHLAALTQCLRHAKLDSDPILYIDADRAQEAFELGLAPFCPLTPLWVRDYVAMEKPL